MTVDGDGVTALSQAAEERLGECWVSQEACHGGYGRFNAEHIITRTLIPESPCFQPLSAFISPHKGAGFKGCDQLVARAETSRPQLRRCDHLKCFELNRKHPAKAIIDMARDAPRCPRAKMAAGGF